MGGPLRLAALVTTAQADTLLDMAETCRTAAAGGATVRVLFRDESIPALCTEPAARHLAYASNPAVHASLQALASAGDTQLYACSSSLYLWGVESKALIPAIHGVRGLIAFLVDDLAGADTILSY